MSKRNRQSYVADMVFDTQEECEKYLMKDEFLGKAQNKGKGMMYHFCTHEKKSKGGCKVRFRYFFDPVALMWIVEKGDVGEHTHSVSDQTRGLSPDVERLCEGILKLLPHYTPQLRHRIQPQGEGW